MKIFVDNNSIRQSLREISDFDVLDSYEVGCVGINIFRPTKYPKNIYGSLQEYQCDSKPNGINLVCDKIYGPKGNDIIGKMIQYTSKGQVFNIKNNYTAQFTYSYDIAHLIKWIILNKINVNGLLNCGVYWKRTYLDALNIVRKHFNQPEIKNVGKEKENFRKLSTIKLYSLGFKGPYQGKDYWWTDLEEGIKHMLEKEQ